MNLRNLADDQLLKSADQAAQREREAITVVLHHLREIESRRLFAKLKYTSLFDYAVKRLKYSEDQAARRISAMRLMKSLPEIENKIESGALSLSSLNLAQTLFRKEDFSRTEKMKLLSELENKSKRESEKIVLSQVSLSLEFRSDRMRVVGPSTHEFKFLADENLARKLDQLRGLLAHKLSQATMNELLNLVCDLAIDQMTPKKPMISRLPAPARVTKSIRANVKREVWTKANNQCENCGSTYALQIDHIQPRAFGGTHDESNLRLLCRSCNQRAAVEKIGLGRMREYWDG